MESENKKELTIYEKLGLFALIIYSILLAIEWITRIIFKNPLPFLSVILNIGFGLIVLSIIVWAFKKRRKKVNKYFSRFKSYFKGTNYGDYIISYVFALVFLWYFYTKPEILLTLSAIYFTIMGFSFTAGSFFYSRESKRKGKIENDFFKTSVFFAINGFLSICLYLFSFVILAHTGDYLVSTLFVLFLFILGILFWIAFRNLIFMLIRIVEKTK